MRAILAILLLWVCLPGFADSAFPASPYQTDLTPGYVLVDGDIQVPLKDYSAFMHGGAVNATFDGTLWPNNTVPFDFVTSGNGAVSSANRSLAINAMRAIEARAGLTFRPATASDNDRIRFQNSQFNSSPVGRRGGTQIINIVNWGSEIIICHEIYHSLGFWHEQSRPDRDTFVTINLNNICGSGISQRCTAGQDAGQCCECEDSSGDCTSCAHNFNVRAGASTYGPYDFDSFMHYGRTDFSCNGGNTIVVKEPWAARWQDAIGQRDHFSYFDGIMCRAIYPFANDRWLDRAHFGFNFGSFEQPYNHSSLTSALVVVPEGGTLLIKHGNAYNGVGTHSKAVTLHAPDGAVVLGD